MSVMAFDNILPALPIPWPILFNLITSSTAHTLNMHEKMNLLFTGRTIYFIFANKHYFVDFPV